MSKLIITKKFEFEAAHHLPNHKGVCRRVHGHRYELEIGITGTVEPKTGMIVDFSSFKAMVKDRIIDRLDHRDLNDLQIPGFPSTCPTAENMVLWIVDQMQRELEVSDLQLALVRLWETSGSRCEWVA